MANIANGDVSSYIQALVSETIEDLQMLANTDLRNMIFAFVFFILGLVLSKYLKSRNKVSDFQVA